MTIGCVSTGNKRQCRAPAATTCSFCSRLCKMCNSAVKIQGPSLLLLELLLLLFIYLVAGRKSISFYHRLFLSFFLTSYQKLVFWALHLFLGTRLSHFMPFNKWSLVSNCVRVFTSIITQGINSEAGTGRKKNLRFCCRISRSAYISVPCVTLNITHGPTKVEENIRWLKIKNFFLGWFNHGDSLVFQKCVACRTGDAFT